MPDVAASRPVPTPSMSEISRIVGVFTSPGAAFADIVQRPRWWIPVLLIGIVSTLVGIAYGQHIGFEQLVRQSIEQSSRGQAMTPAQMNQAVAVGARIAQISTYGGGMVGILFTVFVVSVVMMFLFDNILGADIGLKRMMGIVAYACLPTMVASALTVLVMFLKNPEDFDLRNPLAFNLGAFVSRDLPLWMRSLAGSFDLFSFWVMALIATGVAAASRKIGFGKAFATILFPWALYVALKTAYLAFVG